MKRSPSRTAAALACAAALAFALTACGGDDDAKSSSGGALSTGEFKARANALCKAGFAEVAEIQEEFATATSQEEAEAVVTTFIDRIDELVDDLRDLEPPKDLAGDVDTMLDDVSGVTADVREQGLDFFTDLSEDPFTAANAKATALGLDECAGTGEETS